MKTQEDRLRYILNGGKLRNIGSGVVLTLKHGFIWDETNDLQSNYLLRDDDWEPDIETMKVEFECVWGIAESGGVTYPYSYPPYEILDHIRTEVWSHKGYEELEQ